MVSDRREKANQPLKHCQTRVGWSSPPPTLRRYRTLETASRTPPRSRRRAPCSPQWPSQLRASRRSYSRWWQVAPGRNRAYEKNSSSSASGPLNSHGFGPRGELVVTRLQVIERPLARVAKHDLHRRRKKLASTHRVLNARFVLCKARRQLWSWSTAGACLWPSFHKTNPGFARFSIPSWCGDPLPISQMCEERTPRAPQSVSPEIRTPPRGSAIASVFGHA